MKKSAFILLSLLLLPIASAGITIANTNSWQNVYSAGLYTALQGGDFRFLTSQEHSELILRDLPIDAEITVIESDRIPFVKRYANRLQRGGYDAKTILVPEDEANFDLAKRSGAKSFIIVDPTYGYNAISLLPYAIQTKSYVLFADRDNIQDVTTFLDFIKAENVTLYGDLDPEVRQALIFHNPDTINEGNRFKNNIEIIKRLKNIHPTRQAVLTNGEFLEQDLFAERSFPLIFIGRERPPNDIMDYLKTSDFKSLVLIGNELMPAAQQIRDETEIPLFVKFAKGVTGQGTFVNVEGLDLFPVPRLELQLGIDGLYYNIENQQVELVMVNEKPVRTYLLPSVVLKADNESVQTVGEEDTIVLEDNEERGLAYNADLTLHLDQELTADIFAPYGAGPDALERTVSTTLPLRIISQEDQCDIELNSARYNTATQRYEIELDSEEPCYARITIRDLIVDDEERAIQSDTERVDGKTTIQLKQRMNEVDLADNPIINVEARHGKRATVLSQQTEQELEVSLTSNLLSSIDPTTITLVAVIIALLIIILWQRKKR